MVDAAPSLSLAPAASSRSRTPFEGVARAVPSLLTAATSPGGGLTAPFLSFTTIPQPYTRSPAVLVNKGHAALLKSTSNFC